MTRMALCGRKVKDAKIISTAKFLSRKDADKVLFPANASAEMIKELHVTLRYVTQRHVNVT